jgi:hypothetical protein
MNKLRHWLDDTRNWWAASGLVMGLFYLSQAAWKWNWTISGWPRPTVIASICGIAFGLSVMTRHRWARWLGISWIAMWALAQGINGTLHGWPPSDMVAMAVLIVMGVAYYFLFLKAAAPAADEGDDKPFLSLVLLLREPRYLDATILASLAARAWEIDVSAGDPSMEGEDSDSGAGEEGGAAYIVGEPPFFLAKHPQALLVIHDFDRPYFE